MTSWWKDLELDADYVEYLIGQGLSDRTIRLYAQRLVVAQQWAENRGVSLLDATPSIVAAYTKECVALSYSSRAQARAMLSHFWEWKGREHPPVKAVRVPPHPTMVCQALEEDEARAITKAAIGWFPQGLSVLFAMFLALRREEIAHAEWSRFDIDRQWYRVTGKGQVTATLPVHQILTDELALVPKSGQWVSDKWVFRGRWDGPVNPATVWQWTKEVAQAAGLGDVRTHQLRHTALATANDRLGDLRAVQVFARHANPGTTAGYTRTTTRRLREVSDSLDYL